MCDRLEEWRAVSFIAMNLKERTRQGSPSIIIELFVEVGRRGRGGDRSSPRYL